VISPREVVFPVDTTLPSYWRPASRDLAPHLGRPQLVGRLRTRPVGELGFLDGARAMPGQRHPAEPDAPSTGASPT
jgi:hypothetical protein